MRLLMKVIMNMIVTQTYRYIQMTIELLKKPLWVLGHETGNWSDEETPRPHRQDTLQAVPAAVRREVRKVHNG